MRTRRVQRHIGESTRLWAGQGLNPKHPEALGASTCLRQAGPENLARTRALSAVTHSILEARIVERLNPPTHHTLVATLRTALRVQETERRRGANA